MCILLVDGRGAKKRMNLFKAGMYILKAEMNIIVKARGNTAIML